MVPPRSSGRTPPPRRGRTARTRRAVIPPRALASLPGSSPSARGGPT